MEAEKKMGMGIHQKQNHARMKKMLPGGQPN